jgi:hypothetical protein
LTTPAPSNVSFFATGGWKLKKIPFSCESREILVKFKKSGIFLIFYEKFGPQEIDFLINFFNFLVKTVDKKVAIFSKQ